jgi:hypothetical protein
MNAVNTHGLFNFTDFLPKKPDEVALKVIKEMFEASVDGEAYDAERWSNYFRPSGMQARTGDPTKQASPNATATSQSAPVAQAQAPATAPVVEAPFVADTPVAPVAPAAAAADGDKAADILAMIRSRQAQ